MKTQLRSLLVLVALLATVYPASAFTFNPNTHLQVYYVFCGREVYVDFVYLQLAGDNDKMVKFYFRNNPSSGAPDTILTFKHQSHFNGETGWMFFDTLSPHNQFGYKTKNSANGFNWNISFVQRWEQNDAEGQKRWVRFKIGSLPANSSLELFTVNGLWDGQGSNSPNVDINTTHPITITGLAGPTGLTASQGVCDSVRLNWTYDGGFPSCPGREYRFLVYRDNFNNPAGHIASVLVTNFSQTSFSFRDYRPPQGTSIVNHNYKVRLALVNPSNFGLIQTSPLSNQATGYSRALPTAPTNLSVSYQGCAGSFTLNWQNPQVYDSVYVEITPNGGTTTVHKFDGSPNSFTGTLGTGVYSAVVKGVDECHRFAASSALPGITRPVGPGPFSLAQPVESSGAIVLDWTPATGATSYTITRTGDGAKEITINDPNTTSYTDADIKVCTPYSYKVTALNTCGSSMTSTLQAPVIQQSVSIWSTQQLTGSKGYYGNRVELSWDAPNNFGFDHYKIYRTPLGSGTPQFLAVVNKNELRYVDYLAQAGVLYMYSISAYSDCNGSINESTAITDVGFRLPIAVVNGHVKFENGTGVDSVEITVERNNGTLGKGLYFDGQGMMTLDPLYVGNPANVLGLAAEMTIELWLRPEQLAGNFKVFEFVNGATSYGLAYDAANAALVQYTSDGVNGSSTAYPISLSTGGFTHIAWVRGPGQHMLFADGEPLQGTTTAYASPGGSQPLRFGDGFTGYMDEIRFWLKSRTTAEIREEYKNILAGDEDGLAAYWRIDEGVGNGVYDISGMDEQFHARHLQIDAHVSWSDAFPAGHQLGNRALTDSVGNYTIRNIRYSGVGNTFTVNPFFSPGGTPHEFDPYSTVLFLGEGNDVQNNVNFVDKSSFLVTGTILYSLPDSMCLNSRAFIYIDEQVAQLNGQPATVDPGTGSFSIDVPIGQHRLSVRQAGHVFHHAGQWPTDGSLYDFQKDESGILFYDSTRVRLIGRVVGGTREAGKKLGFHKSINNIGQAEMTFVAQNGCHSVVVETAPESGEYAVDLLPFKYNVFIEIPSSPELDFGPLDILDLSAIRPDVYEVDTVTNFGGQPIRYDSVLYNVKQNYVHRVAPSVDIADARTGGSLRGDSIFIYLDPQTQDTTIIPLTGLPWPVFFAGKKYPTIISAFEEYINLDQAPDTLVDRVPVTDATVTINNGLGNASGTGQAFQEKLEIRNAEGNTPYTFIGGQPEFTAEADPSEDFTQVLELLLETPTHVVAWRSGLPPFRGYVLGVKPDAGSSFITEGPEVVDYILRDPPGDGSTAKFIAGNTYTTKKSWFLRNVNTFETSTQIKAGQAWFFGGGIVGIGFDTHVENDNNLKFSLQTSIDADGTYVEAATFENEITTSGDPYFPGDESDVFMGKSQNFLFGGADELTMVNTELCNVITACIGPEIMVEGTSFRLGRRENMFLVPQGFKTTFVYSQWQIENYLIPNLTELRNALFSDPGSGYVSHLPQEDPGYGRNNDDTYFSTEASTLSPESTEIEDYTGPSYTYTYPASEAPNDRVRWYNQQIRLWVEALARNEKEKLQAKLMRNISFDAGASLSYTSSHTSADVYNQKFEVALNTTAALAVGGFFAGSGGIFRFTLGVEIAAGGSFSEETEVTNTYGFTLADSQPGDFLSIDVKDSGNGNSPVFSLRGGQTMCPWEQGYTTKYYNPGTLLSLSTIRRELPELDVEPSFQPNVPAHQPARFLVKMRNASPTGDIQWYRLKLLEDTNPYGGKLSIDFDGTPVDQVFEIPAGATVEKTLHLLKDEVDFYEMKVVLYSMCEYDAFTNGAPIYAIDTITISANFVPACSEVNVTLPDDLWVHNVNGGDQVEIRIGDYSIDDANLENIRLQYKPSFTSTWRGIETLWKSPPTPDDLGLAPASPSTTYLWNIGELPDGPYDIRAVSHCTNTDNDYASPVASGIIDRIRPHAFGNPQPADGVLDPNDEIMIQFNETINPASLSALDIDVRAVLNGATLRHETSVELDGINDYIEVPAGTRVDDHPLTIELWIKRLSTGDDILWSQGEVADSAMVFGINASNKLYFKVDNTTVTSNAVVPADNQWYHVAVTLNENKQVNFYLTGIYYAGGFVPALYSIPGNMTFGKAAWANSQYYHGAMHEARIWRTELTEGMLRTQMLKKLSGAENGLSLLWPMDEGTGAQLREVVRKKHATLLGNWAIEPSGFALDLDGTNYLRVHAGTMVFTDQHDFTLEFWLKGAKNGLYQTLLSNGRGDNTDSNEAGWCIKAGPDGRLLVDHGGQTSVGIDEDILDDNWHHVALALGRQGNLNCFLDGVLTSSVFGNIFGEFAGPYLWVGARGWFEGTVENQDQKFGGALDEVRVWRSRLTSEQIRANMQNRLAGDEFGLELYLPFESYAELGGIPVLTQTMTDQSPQARTVTPVGAPAFQAEDPNIKLTAPFEKVNFTWSINDDKIIITPTTDPLKIERTTLFISLDNVEDVYGNEIAGPVNWVAFVNKNQLQWSEDELYFEKPEKEVLEFTAEITNSGGIELGFEILGLPDWLAATPAVGTIAPSSTKTIRFTVSPAVRIGDYSTEISLLSGQGYNDKLALDLHVFGVPPSWSVDPAQYPHSMTILTELRIGNSLSEDPLDRVAAFINGEVRGMATLEYFPALDKYLAFLEVYHNGTSLPVSFKAWDASTGTTYANVNIKTTPQASPVPTIPYNRDLLVGSAALPAQLIVTNDVIQEIPINAGWTWISFNVVSSRFNNLDLFFDELSFENNDYIESQTKNATYNPSTGWQGNLKTEGLDFRKMYKCDFTHADILRVAGPRVNPATNPITIVKGWNWIPFLSAETIEVNAALNFNNPTAGDILKSQDRVAVFTNGLGWVGTLTHLEPGKGYMLFADKAGSITFPQYAVEGTPHDVMESPLEQAIKWRSGSLPDRIEGQERNMTVIARLDSEVPIPGQPVIAAMADGVLLDLLPGHRVEGTEDLYYFTLQASGPDRMVYFEVYDADGQYAGLAEEKIYWSADQHLGSLEDPYVLHLRAEKGPAFEAYPNPFTETLYLEYEAARTGPVSIRLFDAAGRLVHTAEESVVRPGLQQWTLSGNSSDGKPLVTGAYIVEIVQGDTVLRLQLVRA